MTIARQIAAISLMVLGLMGCDGFKGLAVDLSGKADATQLFWARLQGIQWHGNKDISSLSEQNVARAGEFDVAGVARGFSMLSEKHSQLATQLMALDAKKEWGVMTEPIFDHEKLDVYRLGIEFFSERS